MPEPLGPQLDDVTSLDAFMASVADRRVPADERRDIVEQGIVLLEDLYVHLEFKQVIHGVDALRRLRRLHRRIGADPDETGEPPLSEAAFHGELVATFAALGDLHTAYLLPSWFHRRVAFLPFTLESHADAGEERFIVTFVRPGHARDGFGRGVEVLHWNGVPIARAVELQAERSAGSNAAARRWRGLGRLTCRYLALEYRPDEDWVDVGFSVDGEERERRFTWQVGRLRERTPLAAPPGCGTEAAFRRGNDAGAEMRRLTRTALLDVPPAPGAHVDAAAARRAVGDAEGGTPAAPEVLVPASLRDVLAFRRVCRGRYGYLRIHSFDVPDRAAFVDTVRRILESPGTPRAGLMIDVRNNPGGDVTAAEYLLQLLTGAEIQPQRFQFPASERAATLAGGAPFAAWRRHFPVAAQTGERLTPGEPLERPENFNAIGQCYHGRVVLLVDALSYSATDMFAAGFQDHGIGPLLGTSARTGAGGATVADHACLADGLAAQGSPLRAIPSGASFSIALRRSVRVGEHAGAPIEDLGVRPDEAVHALTRDDLLERNRDLIAAAGRVLDAQPEPYRITWERDGTWLVIRTSADIDRVDVHRRDGPWRSPEVQDGIAGTGVSKEQIARHEPLRLLGWVRGRRVVSLRITL